MRRATLGSAPEPRSDIRHSDARLAGKVRSTTLAYAAGVPRGTLWAVGKPFADPARRHNATQAVLNAVRTYGAAHADSYGDVRDNNGQVVASFAGDLDEHLAQLQSLVSNPASVAVEQAACSSAYLATITSAIRERFAGDPRRVLWRTANGSVGLRAPFEHLAAELHAEY
jgi:hypothetical protein